MFKKFDLFGQSFEFNVTEERKKYETNTGSLFTIFCLVLTCLGLYIFSSNYFNSKSPRVTIIPEFTGKYPKINLSEEKFVPPLAFFSITGMLTIDQMSKYITPIISKVEVKINPETNQPEKKTIKTQTYMDARDAKFNEENFGEFLEASGTKQFFDLGYGSSPEDMTDEELWTVEGAKDSQSYSYVSIDIYPCSLPDPTQCAPIEDLVLYDLSFSMSYYTYKTHQKENPKNQLFVFEKYVTGINPVATSVAEIDFKKIIIKDEDKDFLKARLNKEFFTLGKIHSRIRYRALNIYCDSASIQAGNCSPYAKIFLISGNEVNTVIRTYPKLFSMISEFGGFGDLIFILVGFFYFFYNDYFFSRFKKEKFLRVDLEDGVVDDKGDVIKREIIEKAKKDYIEKKMRGVDFLGGVSMFDGLKYVLLTPDYAKALQIIPVYESIERKEQEDEIFSTKMAIEEVLKTEPKNSLQELIRNKLKEIVKEGDERIIAQASHQLDILDFDFDLKQKKSNGPTRKKLFQKKQIISSVAGMENSSKTKNKD